MPDLHGWISEKVTGVEERARACPPSSLTFEDGAGDYAPVEVREASGRAHAAGLLVTADTVLRRCAADRKLLEIHSYRGGICETYACNGCGSDDIGALVDHVNDCETLIALAEGYGITAEELAALDRPEKPRLEPGQRPDWDVFGKSIDALLHPATPTSAVPAALRGPNWKARP